MDRVVSGEDMTQEFICVICLDLVDEPMDCVECQNLYCTKCLEGIKMQCPNKCESRGDRALFRKVT